MSSRVLFVICSLSTEGRSLPDVIGARDFDIQKVHLDVHKLRLKSYQNHINEELKTLDPDVLIFVGNDLRLFLKEGDLFKIVKQTLKDAPILALAEAVQLEKISDADEMSWDDFVIIPATPAELSARIRRLLKRRGSFGLLTQSIKERIGLMQLIGKSPAFMEEVNKIPRIAKCDASILISGETGTGKELCARAIHYLSLRSEGPFMPVNCGAIPVDLIENELFGHNREAFTGASGTRMGLISEAEKGTLFLDEIDCLSLSAQVKLLRFLQHREYRPLGSVETRRADVRVLAATNTDLQEALRNGKIRQDLYYRLNVIPFKMPSLRQRSEDIPLLAEYFLKKYATEFHQEVKRISFDAMRGLILYDWPGNVRELESVIERAVLMGQGDLIEPSDILVARAPEDLSDEAFGEAKAKVVAEFEKSYLRKILLAHGGNITNAARAARKNRRAFWQLMRKHRIDAAYFKSLFRSEIESQP